MRKNTKNLRKLLDVSAAAKLFYETSIDFRCFSENCGRKRSASEEKHEKNPVFKIGNENNHHVGDDSAFFDSNQLDKRLDS